MPLSPGLFGRHVEHRPQRHTLRTDRLVAHLTLGKAEVHDMRFILQVDHDVAGLYVAVDDSLLMRIMKCIGNFGTKGSHFAVGQFAAAQPLVQRYPIDELADDADRPIM